MAHKHCRSLLAAFLSAAMLLSVLSGCSGGVVSEAPQKQEAETPAEQGSGDSLSFSDATKTDLSVTVDGSLSARRLRTARPMSATRIRTVLARLSPEALSS